jgi:diguanylate cyclase (GGDEF)-like protein
MDLYIYVLILTIVVSIGLTAINFQKRNFIGAKSLFFLSLALTIYATGYLFEVLSGEIAIKTICYNIEYIGISTMPFFWIMFALQYSDFNRFIVNKRIYFLMVIPVVTIILTWTNRYHGFMIKVMGVSANGAVPELFKINGPWYWVNLTYSYLLILIGTIILLRSIFNLPPLYLKQGTLLIIGSVLPLIGSIFYVFKLTPLKSFDFTSVAMAASGILLTISLYRLKVFQIIPIVRDKIFDNMEDIYIVFDGEGKIIDANKSAQTVLDFNIKSAIGTDIYSFFKSRKMDGNLFTHGGDKFYNLWNNLDKKIQEKATAPEPDQKFLSADLIKNLQSNNKFLLFDNIGGIQRYYSVSLKPVEKFKNIISGYIMILHDITENKVIEQELYRSRQKIENFNEVIFKLNICDSEEEVFSKIDSYIKKNLGLDSFSFFIFNSGLLEKKYVSGFVPDQIFKNEFFYNRMLKHFEKNSIESLSVEEFFNTFNIGDRSISSINDLRFMIFIPVKNVGIFIFFTNGKEQVSENNIKFLDLLGNQSVVALKRIWLQKSLKEQAEVDPLTGVYNRRYFDKYIETEIERAKRYGYPITFIMLDVDRFKEVNDLYGHQIGDLVLKSVGSILMGQTRKIDTVIRYGGDEFLLILPNFKNENIDGFMNRLNTAVMQWSEEVKILEFNLELSIGIALWEPRDDVPVDKIVGNADMMMYEDKRKKRNGSR